MRGRSESLGGDLVLMLELGGAVSLWRGSEGAGKVEVKGEASEMAEGRAILANN